MEKQLSNLGPYGVIQVSAKVLSGCMHKPTFGFENMFHMARGEPGQECASLLPLFTSSPCARAWTQLAHFGWERLLCASRSLGNHGENGFWSTTCCSDSYPIISGYQVASVSDLLNIVFAIRKKIFYANTFILYSRGPLPWKPVLSLGLEALITDRLKPGWIWHPSTVLLYYFKINLSVSLSLII